MWSSIQGMFATSAISSMVRPRTRGWWEVKQAFKNLLALQALKETSGFFFSLSSSCSTIQGMTSTGLPMPLKLQSLSLSTSIGVNPSSKGCASSNTRLSGNGGLSMEWEAVGHGEEAEELASWACKESFTLSWITLRAATKTLIDVAHGRRCKDSSTVRERVTNSRTSLLWGTFLFVVAT